MKITKADISAAAVPPAFSSEFDSKLPTEAELRNAAADPSADPLTADRASPVLAGRMQRDAVALAQAAQVISVNSGFGGFASLGDSSAKYILQAVGQATFDSDTAVQLITSGVESIIDVSSIALGSVPFIGAAAKAMLASVLWAYKTIEFQEKLPPIYQMNPRKDEDETIRALVLLKNTGGDWTDLFLPKTQYTFVGTEGEALPGGEVDLLNPEPGGWIEEARDDGMEFTRPPAPGSRFGCAPGSLVYVDDGVQSRITTGDVTIPSSSSEPRYTDVLRAGKNSQAVLDLVFSRGEWLPSLSALARGVWGNMGQAESVSMFNVRAGQLEREWQGLEDSMTEWRNFLRSMHGDDYSKRMPGGSKYQQRSHIAFFLSRVGAAFHDRYNISTPEHLEIAMLGRKTNSGATVGKRAVEQAKNLRKRQYAAIKTSLNALVSADAPAFAASPTLRDALLTERTALLESSKFDGISVSEVPDAGLRQRIADRQPAISPERARQKQQMEAWLLRKTMPKPLGFDRLGVWEPSDGAGAAPLAIAAGIGFLLF